MREQKSTQYFVSLIYLFIFFCMYKMNLISAEGYKNAGAHCLKIRKTDEILSLKIKSWQILLNAVEAKKKRGIKAIDGFTKKLMISDNEISVCLEYEVKLILGTIFVNQELLEEYSVKIYEIDPYFYEHDVYFTKYFLAVEIDEKGHTDRDLIFEEKRQKALEKKLNCEFIRINTSRENYDANYEASRIQTLISNSNKNKIKELEGEIKKLKLQLANPSVENNDNDKK